MESMIFQALLVALAAFFKAVSDTLAHHFDTSVFRFKLLSPFWNPNHPKNDEVKRIFNYPLDAWHISNSIMVCLFIAGIFFPVDVSFWWRALLYVCLGGLFILVFNIFYDKVLRAI